MLTLDDLIIGYNSSTCFALPSITLETGKAYLLRGNSGSGKTTLIHCLAGLGHLRSGKITLDGIDLYSLDEAERDRVRGEKIGLIFQTLHLIKSLTVLENILLASYLSKKSQDTAAALLLLEQLGLKGLADRPASMLSQGQAQRVAMARALVKKPAVVLADEPTSSLDDSSCQLTLNTLTLACAEIGATLVVASHDGRINQQFDKVIELGGAS